ncbi:MAG: hypothetical protein AAFW84_04245 [Cyanobacteria bacterium J06635_15]
MKNTTYALIACLFLSTACGQRAELATEGESAEINLEQASETVPSKSAESESSAESGNDIEGVEEEPSSLEGRADAAKLSSEAATELINLDNNNQRGIPFKVVVPTYVPEGFEVSDMTYEDGRFGPRYDIQYLNAATNECFEISGASGGFGGPQENFEQLSEIESQALGKLNLGYTESDSVRGQPLIAFEDLTVPGTASVPQLYSFWSRSSEGCDIVDFQEAEQVSASLNYLNP